MIKKIILTVLMMCSAWMQAQSQEMQANVEVMSSRIQGADPKVFTSLKTALTEFINNRKWTNDFFAPLEKIDCNFFLNITEMVGAPEDNTFKGTLTVQATRPVFNATYTTTTFSFLDREVAFKFEPSQVLIFDDNRVGGTDALVANLPATIAFYVYMILGFDYDSFSPNGGDPHFKKAQNVVMNAPEDTRLITGWKSNVSRKTNRFWLVDQVLNPRFQELRQFWYDYHINGMDVMRENPDAAIDMIAGYFEKLKKVNLDNPTSIYLLTMMNTKSNELVNLVARIPQAQRKAAIDALAEVDVTNAAKYKAIR